MEFMSIPIIGFWFFGVQSLGLYFTSTNKLSINKKILEDKEELKKTTIFSFLLFIPFHLWCFILQILAPQRVLIIEYFFNNYKERILFFFSFSMFLFTKKTSNFSNFFEIGDEFQNNLFGLTLLLILFLCQKYRKKYLKKLTYPTYFSVGITSLFMSPLIFILFLFSPYEILKEFFSIHHIIWIVIYSFFINILPPYVQSTMISSSIDKESQQKTTEQSKQNLIYYEISLLLITWNFPSLSFLLMLFFLFQSISPFFTFQNLFVGLKFILSDSDSKIMFIYLCINLLFMFVELFYGILSNSLGLISDAIHMLFDSGALAIGLYGSYMSKWKPNQSFTYGYGRYSVISGFVNGILLVCVGAYILIEAVHRIFHPPIINGQRLLSVSIIGLLINLSGIFFLSPHHHHHAHDHHDGECEEEHGHTNENKEGVFLHMLADTIASVSVIISTLLIKYFNMYFADALCSIFISVVIMLASYPLLKHSSKVLMLSTPTQFNKKIEEVLKSIKEWKGVLNVNNVHFWTLNSENIVGSFHVKIEDDLNEQEILTKIRNEFPFVHDLTIQIEKKKLLLSNSMISSSGNHFSV
eukprot:gene12440-6192_t